MKMSEKAKPVYKQIIEENIRKAMLDEYLSQQLENSGYSKVELASSAIRERVLVFSERPGIVIGKRGRTSKRLSEELAEKFGFENPFVEAMPVKNPYLDARIVANRMKRKILLGDNPRRVGYFTARNVMEAGALGVEIIMNGKFGSARARSLRFRDGIMLKTGYTPKKYIDEAVTHVLLKQGMIGIKVRILRPELEMPDKVLTKEEVGGK